MRQKEVPFYPLVLAAFPILGVMSSIPFYAPFSQSFKPLLIVLVATAGLTLLLSLVLRNVQRGAAVSAVSTLCFLGFEWSRQNLAFIPFGSSGMHWGVMTAVAVGLVAWKPPSVRAMNVIAVCVLGVALVNLGTGTHRVGAGTPS